MLDVFVILAETTHLLLTWTLPTIQSYNFQELSLIFVMIELISERERIILLVLEIKGALCKKLVFYEQFSNRITTILNKSTRSRFLIKFNERKIVRESERKTTTITVVFRKEKRQYKNWP